MKYINKFPFNIFSKSYLKFIIAIWPFIFLFLGLSTIKNEITQAIFPSLAFFTIVSNAIYIVIKILLYRKNSQ